MDFDPIAYINEPRWQTSRLGLERISELLDKLGNPQNDFKSIHVAGTNGKGSSASFIASILQSAHYRTGLFTSPGLSNDFERIQLNGKPISLEKLYNICLRIKKIADEMKDHPSEFELMSAIAFEYFKSEGCECAVIEVGMGGRLDSTNVLSKPDLCVLTPISLDHTEYLGDTIEQIAAEKAGIIKNGVAVVSWPQADAAQRVINQSVAAHNATLTQPDFSQLTIEIPDKSSTLESRVLTFNYRHYHNLCIKLIGSYQPYNAALAIEAIEVLRQRGYNISDEALRIGLQNTRWPARFEVLSTSPTFIIDGGHNLEGIKALVASLALNFPDQKFIFIVSVLQDKDYLHMIDAIVSLGSCFITFKAANPRALGAHELAWAIEQSAHRILNQSHIPEVSAARSAQEAVHKAYKHANNSEVICAFGSLYSVAEIKKAVSKRE